MLTIEYILHIFRRFNLIEFCFKAQHMFHFGKCSTYTLKKHVFCSCFELCFIYVSQVQFSSVAQSCLNLCNPIDCSKPGLSIYHQFPMSLFFSSESVLCIRWPKYWSFSFNISPSNEYSGLISFRMDWLDLLAVQGTLKSLLQHHSSKASILQHSVLFYSPTLTSIHDHWKNHSFDQMDLCWQSNVSAF